MVDMWFTNSWESVTELKYTQTDTQKHEKTPDICPGGQNSLKMFEFMVLGVVNQYTTSQGNL
jgi:hypothetical protein